jgi:hypothetical protein
VEPAAAEVERTRRPSTLNGPCPPSEARSRLEKEIINTAGLQLPGSRNARSATPDDNDLYFPVSHILSSVEGARGDGIDFDALTIERALPSRSSSAPAKARMSASRLYH